MPRGLAMAKDERRASGVGVASVYEEERIWAGSSPARTMDRAPFKGLEMKFHRM